MRLSLENLHLYLLDKGFMEPASLLNGDYMAALMQTRNFIFQVTRHQAPSLFIKQLNSFDASNTYVLQKEATCLWLIKNHPAFARLSDYVPNYFGFDPEKQVLVTEFLTDANNLEACVRLHNGSLPLTIREELATLLASYHFPLGTEVLKSRSVQFFPRQVPWVLNLAEVDPSSPQALSSLTSASNPVLNAVLGSPDLKKAVAISKSEWEPTSLIHGDLKWINLLTHPAEGREKVKVIDWEIADIGDPLWDVAGILQGFVTSLIFYHPAVAGDTFGLVPGLGLAHLQDAWPMMDHFWQLFRAHTAPDAAPGADTAALAKVLRFTSVRLIQAAFEYNQLLPTLQPNPIKLLQASHAILTNASVILHYFNTTPAVAIA